MYLQRSMHCVLYVCCTLMHQGAVGFRGGCERELGWTPLLLVPPPSPNTAASHSVTLRQVSQSVRQSSRAVGQAELAGGKECAAHLSSCTPPVLPSLPACGGVSGCLGCLENFFRDTRAPCLFWSLVYASHALCPPAPHHTTTHHSTAITTTVQHALHVHTYPVTPVPWPGCQAALALGQIWNGRSCVTRPPRLRCLGEVPRPRRAPVVLAVSWSRVEKLLLPSQASTIKHTTQSTTTSLRFNLRVPLTQSTLVCLLLQHLGPSQTNINSTNLLTQFAVLRTRSAGLVTVTFQHQHFKPITVTTSVCVCVFKRRSKETQQTELGSSNLNYPTKNIVRTRSLHLSIS